MESFVRPNNARYRRILYPTIGSRIATSRYNNTADRFRYAMKKRPEDRRMIQHVFSREERREDAAFMRKVLRIVANSGARERRSGFERDERHYFASMTCPINVLAQDRQVTRVDFIIRYFIPLYCVFVRKGTQENFNNRDICMLENVSLVLVATTRSSYP